MKDKDSRSLHAKDLKGLLAGETNAAKTLSSVRAPNFESHAHNYL